MSGFLFHLPAGKASWTPISFSLLPSATCGVRVLFVEKGRGECKVSQQTIQINEGELLLIAPDEICDFSGLEQAERWLLTFDTDTLSAAQLDTRGFSMLFGEEPLFSFINSSSERCKPSERSFKPGSKSRLCWPTCLRQLEQEVADKSFGYTEVVHSLLKLLFFDVLRLFRERFKPYSSSSLVSKAICFIEKNYQDSISLSDVAVAVERSPAYLTDLVRRETGKTVLNWIVEYRMANARQLLLLTDYPVSQIAEQVGYFDRRHFSRQFLRSHKTTPQRWRNLNCTTKSDLN